MAGSDGGTPQRGETGLTVRLAPMEFCGGR